MAAIDHLLEVLSDSKDIAGLESAMEEQAEAGNSSERFCAAYDRILAEHGCAAQCWKLAGHSAVIELFMNGNRRFEVSRIDKIRNVTLAQYTSSLCQVTERRRTSQTLFNPVFTPSSEKDMLLNRLRGAFLPRSLLGEDLQRTNSLFVWHGAPSEAVAKSIAENGCASLQSLDAGYYGLGIYASLESEYACMYAAEYPDPRQPNCNGEWAVILALGVVGVAYPITLCRDDFPEGPLPPDEPEQCAFYGNAIKSPYDTHIVPVSGPDFLTTAVVTAEYHEVVFKQDAQVLPLAIVWFRKVQETPA